MDGERERVRETVSVRERARAREAVLRGKI